MSPWCKLYMSYNFFNYTSVKLKKKKKKRLGDPGWRREEKKKAISTLWNSSHVLGRVYYTIQKYGLCKTFLVIQWLRLPASNAWNAGSIPGLGTKITHAVWHSQKNFFKEIWYRAGQIIHSKCKLTMKTKRASVSLDIWQGKVQTAKAQNRTKKDWFMLKVRVHKEQIFQQLWIHIK